MALLNFNFDDLTPLSDWWRTVKGLFTDVNNQVEGHVTGVSDKHNAQDIQYSGDVINATNVKQGLDTVNSRLNTILTTPIDGGTAAQELVDARGGKATLGARIDSIEFAGVPQTPTVGFGLTKIKYTGSGVPFPEISIKGKHYINILGKDGDCEDVSKWTLSGATSSLDSSNKIFGGNSIKITITGTSGAIFRALSDTIINTSKYYLLSGYIKNSNATNIGLYKSNAGGGNLLSILSTDTTKFVRVGLKIAPSDLNIGNNISIWVNGSAGQYGYVDGIMLNELTSDEYALPVADLLSKYPYVDGLSVLRNPLIENRRKNLCLNGNGEFSVGYWQLNGGVTLNRSNGYFQTGISSIYQDILINPGATYSYRVVVKAGTANPRVLMNYQNDSGYVSDAVDQTTTSAIDTVFSGSFVAPATAKYLRVYINATTATQGSGIAYFKEWMVVEDTEVPTTYISCEPRSFLINKGIYSDDTITITKEGRKEGEIWWKEVVLNGRDYAFVFGNDIYTGWKYISLANGIMPKPKIGDTNSWISTKYDGSMMYNDVMASGPNRFYHGNLDTTYISISDSDSGWLDNVSPNNDEVKAFMNGWKATWQANNRYTSWVSIIDNSAPLGTPQTTTTSNSASGQKNMTVASIANLAINDWVSYKMDNGNWQSDIISGINGNTLTLYSDIPTNVASGNPVFKCDNAIAGTTNLLTWCTQNIAPNYAGYKLSYKLANPETPNDNNCQITGNIWNLEPGDNYVNIDSGVVLGERPYNITYDSTYYFLNGNSNPLRNKVENILRVYKNGLPDNTWEYVSSYISTRGNGYMRCPLTSFDPSAIYTVDYTILKNLHNKTCTSLSFKYILGIGESIEECANQLENKQQKSSYIDTLIGLSNIETLANFNTTGSLVLYGKGGYAVGLALQIFWYVSIMPKRVKKPNIIYRPVMISTWDNTGVAVTIPLTDFIFDPWVAGNTILFRATYRGTDANIKSYLVTNQVRIEFDYFAVSCEGKV